MRLLSPDAQPDRAPGDPGPDWRPRFGFHHAVRWTAEGFLIPLAIFMAVLGAATAWAALQSDQPSLQEALRQGSVIATFGYFLTGGSIFLTWIFTVGPRWSTLFRFIGCTLAFITQWNINDWLIGQW